MLQKQWKIFKKRMWKSRKIPKVTRCTRLKMWRKMCCTWKSRILKWLLTCYVLLEHFHETKFVGRRFFANVSFKICILLLLQSQHLTKRELVWKCISAENAFYRRAAEKYDLFNRNHCIFFLKLQRKVLWPFEFYLWNLKKN